jgi:hypothetical protein
MPKLIFYRQKRQDGAIRTGVELDDRTIAERYEEGEEEHDPALLWYVDLRCIGPGIPDDPSGAEHWLLRQSPIIHDGYARYAETLRVGADPDLYSLTWSDFVGVPEDVRMTIACSAIRRIDAREMSSILAEIGGRWDELMKELDIAQEVEEIR